MSLALWLPTPPVLPLPECTDGERRIERRCWDLVRMQTALRANQLQLTLTPSAAKDIQTELLWSRGDVIGFVQCLHGARYRASEWGLPAGHAGNVPPLAADAYVMGYNRLNGEENQKTRPWVYFKFAIRPNIGVVLVLSAHLER